MNTYESGFLFGQSSSSPTLCSRTDIRLENRSIRRIENNGWNSDEGNETPVW